jgi:serine/threonine protein phosphatase PrpC
MLPELLREDPDFKAGRYVSALTTTFLRLDDLLSSKKGEEELRNINRQLKAKTPPSNEPIAYRSGTTCLAMLLTKDKYYIANVGDSRAILSRNYQAVTLSNDHKPDMHA